tara:strand:+ start:9332 stop:10348 length:1017 start_codon:yes stop_codon:yes gene_type:complete
MKSLYITGVAGLIGSNLAKHFLKEGYKVKGCDSLVSGYYDNIPLIEWDNIDILDLDKLSNSMRGYDIVIHCAALPYEGVSVFSPKLITENIYSGTISVATAAIKNNYELFINCSSMARYGKGQYEPPFKEVYKPMPQDPYGMAKSQAEEVLNLLSDIHGLKVIHTVPHNLIGPGQVYTDPFRNVAAIFANKILLDNKVIVYGSGEQKRSFSHVYSCVLAFDKLVQNRRKFRSKSIFNIGPDGNEITINDLVALVGIACQIVPEIEYMPSRPQEVKNAFCSSERAIMSLNYDPNVYSNEETISDLVTWIMQRGPQPFNYHLELEIINNQTPKTWTDKLI